MQLLFSISICDVRKWMLSSVSARTGCIDWAKFFWIAQITVFKIVRVYRIIFDAKIPVIHELHFYIFALAVFLHRMLFLALMHWLHFLDTILYWIFWIFYKYGFHTLYNISCVSRHWWQHLLSDITNSKVLINRQFYNVIFKKYTTTKINSDKKFFINHIRALYCTVLSFMHLIYLIKSNPKIIRLKSFSI